MLKKNYPLLILFHLVMTINALGQVDLPTGKANYSLPVFNYNDGGRLSFDMSLIYTGGGGILVNQIPSTVGLGWTLMAGGVITRRTIGDPDDQMEGTYGGVKQGNGYLVPYFPRLDPISPKAGFVPLIPSGAADDEYQPGFDVLKDLQQDIFEFQFGGRTGRFIINDDQRIYPMDNSKLRIEKREIAVPEDGNVITTISKFIITDETGIKYTFSACERSNLIKYKKGRNLTTTFGETVVIPYFDVSDYSVRTAWYLTEIKDPLSGHKITFNYTDYKVQYLIGYEGIQTASTIDGQTKVGAQSLPLWFSGTRKRLTDITFPDGRTKVALIYHDGELADLPGEKALKQVVVQKDSDIISGYQFGYEYFFKDSTRAFNYSFGPDEFKFARLCLKTVQKTGKFNLPDAPFAFSYYNNVDGNYVPGRAFTERDHWGYSNGHSFPQNYNTPDECMSSIKVLLTEFNRKVVSGAAIMGALKSVQYPTGGKLLYEYENNEAFSGGAVKLSGGIRVKKTTLYDMVDTTKKIIKQYRYVNADGNTSSGWGYETPVYTELNYTNLVVPPSGSGYKVGNFIFSTAFTTNVLPTVFMGWSVGGVQGLGAFVSYNLFVMAIMAVLTNILTPPPAVQQLVASNAQTFSHHAAMNNELPHMYKRVVVYEGDTTNNIGKMIYEFTSPDEFPITVPAQSQPYAAKSRCLPWVYGLPKSVQEYSRSNKLLSEIKYTYSPQLIVAGNFSIAWKPKRALMCPEYMFSSYSSIIELYSDKYTPILGRTNLTAVTKRDYDSIGNFTQLLTSYTYNASNLLPSKTQTVNSVGDTIETANYYPQDYNSSNLPVHKALSELNMISTPIATEIRQNNATGQKLINASITEYKFQFNGDIKPEQLNVLQSSTPLPASVTGPFTGTTLNRIPAYIKQQQVNNFDADGNLVHTFNSGGMEAGYKWGYGGQAGDSKQRITAFVQNAHQAHNDKKGLTGAVTNNSFTLLDFAVKTTIITLAQSGTIYLHLDDYDNERALCTYTLTGGSPVKTYNGTLCMGSIIYRMEDSYNTYFDNFPRYKVFADLPAGTYTLSVQRNANSMTCKFGYTYFTDPGTPTPAEFSYEGFEETPYSGTVKPYAGIGCKEGDYTTTFTIPNSRNYRVDYRYLSGGKWLFNAKPYTNGMILSDGTAIDEVRIYPVDAVITTFTYDPTFGPTSETDLNGNTLFKEYDYLGRTSFIRDQDGNILQRICYNYTGQPEQCGGKSYGNTAMSQVFTNQTCTNGYTPGVYAYSIPAATYLADDQIAANVLALEDIKKNGQSKANQLSGCFCSGGDKKVINGQCETGIREDYIEQVAGGKCREAYRYKFSDGTTQGTVLGNYVVCP
jgi:hypothetical protein